ncbi:MAG TPA: radical SAM protein [Anaeromyxobacteraceae bacterium]|nr:radical SAM protein [Anaeromyxobacteraceae bacterium]
MRALLVNGRSPSTYWSYDFSLPFAGKEAALPPLGLATLAALLPDRWEIRMVDLQVDPLDDEDIRWADAVLVSGMLVQADSMREVVGRARALGRRTVVGGPAPTTSPGAFPEADHVFRGEAEGRLDVLVAALESPGLPAPRLLSPPGDERPSLDSSPVPRFDLLDLGRYASYSIQVSRGCPFRCEFCDIIEVYGRVPRLKSPRQVIAELDALLRAGGPASVFVVDDNFIGNRRAAAELLPRIAEWQGANGAPFDFYTEASLDLAAHPELVSSMVEAGFSAVFVGVETPSAESLRGAGKVQNLRVDPAEAVASLTRAGLEVLAGFIVGFDADGPDIFDRQEEFISRLPLPMAMVGILGALPGTALWRRLEREGRLRAGLTGDQFGRANFRPVLDERVLLRGYRRLLASLYAPGAFYDRCARHVAEARPLPSAPRPGLVRTVARVFWGLGIRSERRGHFWRLVLRSLPRGRDAVARALTLAIRGEHMIRYTAEVALPRLDAQLAALDEAAAAPEAAPVRGAAGST